MPEDGAPKAAYVVASKPHPLANRRPRLWMVRDENKAVYIIRDDEAFEALRQAIQEAETADALANTRRTVASRNWTPGCTR
jgi:hypothetical protein